MRQHEKLTLREEQLKPERKKEKKRKYVEVKD